MTEIKQQIGHENRERGTKGKGGAAKLEIPGDRYQPVREIWTIWERVPGGGGDENHGNLTATKQSDLNVKGHDGGGSNSKRLEE